MTVGPQVSSGDEWPDLHRDARRLLETWSHVDPAQLVLRDEYLDFLAAHPNAMARSCAPGHFTSSALVMDEGKMSVLLTLHPKVGRWLQLGGHNEAMDAGVREAARREAIEEGGIDAVQVSAAPVRLDRHPVPCGGRQSVHWDVQFLATVPMGSVPVMSAESDDLRWFTLDALPTGLDASVQALIRDALSGA
jgi:8-oxo-dGTP pyrophosphatase MutT (NUDIX family)